MALAVRTNHRPDPAAACMAGPVTCAAKAASAAQWLAWAFLAAKSRHPSAGFNRHFVIGHAEHAGDNVLYLA